MTAYFKNMGTGTIIRVDMPKMIEYWKNNICWKEISGEEARRLTRGVKDEYQNATS
jgi:hypothetical protein